MPHSANVELLKLGYAPRAATWRFRLRRALWTSFLLVALTVITMMHWPAISHRARLVYWQHRCMTYTRPATEEVISQRLFLPTTTVEAREQYRDLIAPSLRFGLQGPLRAVLFMHKRTTKSGQVRLVLVQLNVLPSRGQPVYLLSSHVTPGTLWASPSNASEGARSTLVRLPGLPVPTPPSLTVYAGQPDAEDPSHFTARYQSEGTSGTIHGWLVDATDPASPSDDVDVVFDVTPD